MLLQARADEQDVDSKVALFGGGGRQYTLAQLSSSFSVLIRSPTACGALWMPSLLRMLKSSMVRLLPSVLALRPLSSFYPPPSPPLCLVESRPKLAFSLLDGTFDENERLVTPLRLRSSATRGLLLSVFCFISRYWFILFYFVFIFWLQRHILCGCTKSLERRRRGGCC